jgi:hypothetical protein
VTRKLALSAFLGLALATVAAFFIIQHLKVSTPLIAGNPVPFPPTINPVGGGTCIVVDPTGQTRPVSFRRMTVSFFLLNRSDDVDVYVVNQSGTIVATLARGVFMRAGVNLNKTFTWNGREASGGLAPAGRYYVRVVLRRQGRTIDITDSKGSLLWVTVSSSGRCPGAAALRPQ